MKREASRAAQGREPPVVGERCVAPEDVSVQAGAEVGAEAQRRSRAPAAQGAARVLSTN